MMTFNQLRIANWSWTSSTDILVVLDVEDGPFAMSVDDVCTVYGGYKVAWFKDNVVSLCPPRGSSL